MELMKSLSWILPWLLQTIIVNINQLSAFRHQYTCKHGDATAFFYFKQHISTSEVILQHLQKRKLYFLKMLSLIHYQYWLAQNQIFCTLQWFELTLTFVVGKPVYGEPGELVCLKPFPSMPVYFWNDAQGEKYAGAYFSMYPGKTCFTFQDCLIMIMIDGHNKDTISCNVMNE